MVTDEEAEIAVIGQLKSARQKSAAARSGRHSQEASIEILSFAVDDLLMVVDSLQLTIRAQQQHIARLESQSHV